MIRGQRESVPTFGRIQQEFKRLAKITLALDGWCFGFGVGQQNASWGVDKGIVPTRSSADQVELDIARRFPPLLSGQSNR